MKIDMTLPRIDSDAASCTRDITIETTAISVIPAKKIVIRLSQRFFEKAKPNRKTENQKR